MVFNGVGTNFNAIGSDAGTGNLTLGMAASTAGVFTIKALSIGNTTGNIGIGTSTPAEKLQISGGNLLLSNNQGINWLDSGGNGRRAILLTGANDFQFGPVDASWGGVTYIKGGTSIIFSNNGSSGTFSDRMQISASGNVGIGTSTPGATLELRGATSTELRTGRTSNVGVGSQFGFLTTYAPNASGTDIVWSSWYTAIMNATA
jgi:trimeric autotransporter adhesin